MNESLVVVTLSKIIVYIRPTWQIRLQNMVVVTSYFIKQTPYCPQCFQQMHGVLPDNQNPSLTQRRTKESSSLDYDELHYKIRTMQASRILRNSVSTLTASLM